MMRLGLSRIELAASPHAPEHFQPEESNSRLFNLLAEAGIAPIALRVTGLTFLQKLRAISVAAECGIPAILDRVEPLTFPDLVDRLRIYALCAAGAKIQFVIENDSTTSCGDASAQKMLAKIVRIPSLRFAFSPPHAHVLALDPADEIRSLDDSLRWMQLWDVSATASRVRQGLFNFDAEMPDQLQTDFGPAEHQTPFASTGSTDWEGCFRAMGEIRYSGPLNLCWSGNAGWELSRIESEIAGAMRRGAELLERMGWDI